jgi:hypothetical protein
VLFLHVLRIYHSSSCLYRCCRFFAAACRVFSCSYVGSIVIVTSRFLSEGMYTLFVSKVK